MVTVTAANGEWRMANGYGDSTAVAGVASAPTPPAPSAVVGGASAPTSAPSPFPASELLAARKRLGLSQLALAIELNRGQSTYRSWEQGAATPTPQLWYLLAAYLQRHGIPFPFPPGSTAPANGEWRMANGSDTARSADAATPAGEPPALPAVSAPSPFAIRHSPFASPWPAWRAVAKLDGGRWHHRPLERGVTVGLLWNAPFSWELTIEAYRGIVSEEIADRALRLLYKDDGIRLYCEDADTHELVRDPRVRIVQAMPHLVRMRVRTPECSLRWSEIQDIDPTSLLALSGLREAIS